MANTDVPSGASPKGDCLRINKYVAGGTVYPGDFVKQEDTGKIIVAAATNALFGVAMNYAVTDGELLVSDHPEQLYIVQADEADVDAQTDIGLNYNIVATSGNSTYRASRMELDSNTGADTATLPLKLLGIDAAPNNALGAQVKCIVKINNHQLGSHTGTAGV